MSRPSAYLLLLTDLAGHRRESQSGTKHNRCSETLGRQNNDQLFMDITDTTRGAYTV